MNLKGHRKEKEFNLEFVRHSSAKKLVVAFFRHDHPKLQVGDLLLERTPFENFLGKKYDQKASVQNILDCVRSHGLWGFCLHKSKKSAEVHYWIGRQKRVSAIAIMELLGHEIAHAFGYAKENRACKIGAIAGVALESIARNIDPARLIALSKTGKVRKIPAETAHRSQWRKRL